MTAPRRLLWIDDDGPRHYLYELHRLRALGWDVRWATSAADAAAALAAEAFDAALLDQLLPLAPATDGVAAARSVWGGALLAAHLRDPAALAGLPAAVRAAAQPLLHPAPLAANRGLPLLVVSAFDDPEVDELLARPGLAHPRLGPLRRVPKPVDFDDLQGFLDDVLQVSDPEEDGDEEAATVRAAPPEAR
jgi:CheY-like chemotaxis protein